MNCLRKRISDQRFLELIQKSLNAGYMHAGRHQTDIVGSPQGSVISPILANIFLHELDKFIEGLKAEFDYRGKQRNIRTSEAYKIGNLIARTKKKQTLDNTERKITLRKLGVCMRNVESKVVGAHTQKIKYIRYADD